MTPRLQDKYVAELQDIAGLCQHVVSPLTIGFGAIPVHSFEGRGLNEYLLYHGAPANIVDRLTLQGLDPRYAGENVGKLFGQGCYFAANSSKSDIYATVDEASGLRCILITRVALGEAHMARAPCQTATRPPERPDGRGPLNSIVGVTQANGGCVEHPE